MKRPLRTLGPLSRMLWDDGTLVTACVTPLLCGLLYYYGLPWLEKTLPAMHAVTDYHPMLDLLLILLTAYLPLLAAVELLQFERDAGVTSYLSVTPMTRGGYMATRLAVPALLAALYAFAASCLFMLDSRPLLQNAALALLSVPVMGASLLPIAALSRSRSATKVWTRVAGLYLLTAALPYFLPVTWHPYMGLLPTYWLVRALRSGKAAYYVVTLALSALWMLPFALRMALRADVRRR